MAADVADLKARAERLRELHSEEMQRHGRRCSPRPGGSPGWCRSRSRWMPEAGYGMQPRELVDRLLDIGAVGCNLEDTDHRAGGLVEAGAHAQWLAGIRSAADDAEVPIVINARVDTFLPASGIPEPDRVAEAIRRGRLYRDAGADCIYPIGVRQKRDIATLVTELPGPVNGNTGEYLDLATLREMGVARVSYGPRFYRAALADLKTAVQELLA
ncbi:isocitrate lyase/PEP mutase family protein [Microbispora catharanthi]|uniref:isocitrate lyase/PEP mutase family protein n=1 Tax=Microbispora catharanthi TaxID=1712871 RepID=UPI00197C33E9|nr:isocitrate lyase/phosphoenolpyruvate mutase family protein [Microbispora catharanthi]